MNIIRKMSVVIVAVIWRGLCAAGAISLIMAAGGIWHQDPEGLFFLLLAAVLFTACAPLVLAEDRLKDKMKEK